MLPDLAAARPDAIALDDLERRRTFSELLDRATRFGRALHGELGVGPGGHAAVLAGNRVEVVEVLLGSVLAGAWLTAVNWHLTAEEAAYVLDDSGARVVVCDPEHEALARQAAGAAGRDVRVLVTDDGPDALDAVLAAAEDAPFDLDGPAGGSMLYTSGTTGRPKGVKRTTAHRLGDQLAGYATAGRGLGLDGTGPHLVTGPLYHAAPLGFAHMDLHNGAEVVILPRFDAGHTLELLTQREVRSTHLVPTMFVRLLRLPDEVRAAFDPAHLEVVLHGAAPISPAVKRRMIEWWGPVLVEYWGGSEGGVVTLVTSEEWLAHPGTVGRAVAGHEVWATGEDGERLPPGETGLLVARHPSGERAFEYHGDPEKTAGAERGPGAYTLGDIGRVDADGWVHLSDRAANTIISGGVNIYPAEVEAVLAEHPAVADVAVLGVPDEEWGEQVKAVVEPAEGVVVDDATVEDLLAFARRHLAGYKVPRSVDVVDELPRLPTGKLLTRVLRDRYWAGRDRRI